MADPLVGVRLSVRAAMRKLQSLALKDPKAETDVDDYNALLTQAKREFPDHWTIDELPHLRPEKAPTTTVIANFSVLDSALTSAYHEKVEAGASEIRDRRLDGRK